MKSADDLQSWAERIKKITRVPDIIEFCDAIMEFLISKKAKDGAERKRDRREYQKNYMREYRKRKKPKGDFD